MSPTCASTPILAMAASKTDGRIYDPKLGPNEVKGDFSGIPDDRWIFSTTNPFFQWNAIAALAAAADVLKGWDDALAKDCLATAIKAWNEEKAHPTQPRCGFGGAPRRRRPAGGVLAASQGVAGGAASKHGRGSHTGAAALPRRTPLHPASVIRPASASRWTGLPLWS